MASSLDQLEAESWRDAYHAASRIYVSYDNFYNSERREGRGAVAATATPPSNMPGGIGPAAVEQRQRAGEGGGRGAVAAPFRRIHRGTAAGPQKQQQKGRPSGAVVATYPHPDLCPCLAGSGLAGPSK